MALPTKTLGSLTFTIDRPKGTVKEWPQPGGGVKRFVYPVDYGFLRRHTGEDGEALDFFVGDDPDGHLESFQKLKRGDDGRMRMDETKFLAGVNDRDRETIYELYRTEVWHRKVYRTWADLQRDLPKFRGGRKARYGVPKTAGDESMDMYEGLEKQALSFSGAAQKVRGFFQGMAGRGSQPAMISWGRRQTQPWRRPLGHPPPGMSATQVGSLPTMGAVSGVQPKAPVSGVQPTAPVRTPTQALPPGAQPPGAVRSLMEHSAEPGYHPGNEGIANWLEQYDGPEAVRDDAWTVPGGWVQQGALMPQNPGMRQAVLSQRGLWDTDRSIMAEVARQFEQRHAQNPAEAKAYLQRLQGLQGNTPGWTAALQQIPQHYKLSAWIKKFAAEDAKKRDWRDDDRMLRAGKTLVRGTGQVGMQALRGGVAVGKDALKGLEGVVRDTHREMSNGPAPEIRATLDKAFKHDDKVAMLRAFGFKDAAEKLSDIVKQIEGPSRLISPEMQQTLHQNLAAAPLGNSSAGTQTLGAGDA